MSAAEAQLELNWGTVRKTTVTELFDVAARTGYPLVTLSMPYYQESLKRGVTDADMLARMREAGVQIGYLDNAIRELPGVAAVADTPTHSDAEAMRMIEAFGVRKLNITHYGGDPTIGLPVLVDAIGRHVEKFESEGLSIVVEFLPGTGIPDLPTGIELVKQIGLGRVSLLYDTWHHFRSGGRLADFAGLDPRVIGAIQLSDMPSDRIDTFKADDPEAIERNARLYKPMSGRLLPGDGDLPMAEIVAWLRQNVPHVPVGAEIFNADLDALPPAEVAQRTADSILRFIN